MLRITVHYDASRLKFLAVVLRSLSEFPTVGMHVIVATNTTIGENIAVLHRLCGEILQDKTYSVQTYSNLADPFELTWCHKKIIEQEFADEVIDDYSHFIYLEDDIGISFANFFYFVHYRAISKSDRLIPSFLRVEYNQILNGFANTDHPMPADMMERPYIEVGGTVLVNMPNPYCACFILDADLAAEYISTRSFDKEGSVEVSGWGVRERAAMGLCFENVPEFFSSRYVVPVSKQTSLVPSFAWISHVANNYADDPDNGFGKVRMDSLVVNISGAVRRAVVEMVDQTSQGNAVGVRNEIVRRLWRGADPFHGFPKKLVGVDLQGWNSEHPFLSETVARDRPKIIVELGVWKGASTIGMAKQLRACGIDGAIIAVDTWLGSTEHWTHDEWFDDLSVKFGYPQVYYKFLTNVIHSELENFVVPLPLDSLNACHLLADKNIVVDMIHIDASHHYEAVLIDLQLWWRRLRSGGVFIGDDYYLEGHWPGVKRAVDEFLSLNPHRDFEVHQGKCRAIKL